MSDPLNAKTADDYQAEIRRCVEQLGIEGTRDFLRWFRYRAPIDGMPTHLVDAVVADIEAALADQTGDDGQNTPSVTRCKHCGCRLGSGDIRIHTCGW